MGAASSFGGEGQLNRGKEGRVISKLRVQLPTEHQSGRRFPYEDFAPG